MTALLVASCAVQEAAPPAGTGRPYTLSPQQTYTVRDYVSTKFYLPRAVHMHEMTASIEDNGIINVCGMADALGQEGPGEAIGYRAYVGFLAPDRDDFIVTKLADNAIDQKVIFELCRRRGAPIQMPPEAQRMLDAINN